MSLSEDDDSVDPVDCKVTKRGVACLVLSSSDALLLLILLCKLIFVRSISSDRQGLLTLVISLGADMVVMMVFAFVAFCLYVAASIPGPLSEGSRWKKRQQ